MSKDQKRLGRSLASIFPPNQQTDRASDQPAPLSPMLEAVRGLQPSNRLANIPVDVIRFNPMQPRRSFDERSLASLATSIRERGTLQPIVVRPANGGYELIAGERRLRAARLAEIRDIPAIIRATSEEELLELALIENVQRADLNAVDRARAYRVLHETYGLPHEEIGRRMGEDRATVTNYLRLLSLPQAILNLVEAEKLSLGHAKAILGVPDSDSQIKIADRAVAERWSVRQIERAVGHHKGPAEPGTKQAQQRPTVKDMEDRLCSALSTKVQIREGRRRHTGRIIIEYYSLDDFERIAGIMGVPQETS